LKSLIFVKRNVMQLTQKKLKPTFSLCVFCGAKPGNVGSTHTADARKAGRMIAEQGWRLVYGGGSNGLMGEVANGALEAKGQVLGVITEHLVNLEMAHRDLTELRIVPDMAIRKTRLIEESDAFLILPGGMGTLDELFEVITLAQLGVLSKPIVIYNPAGFYDSLVKFANHLVAEGFVKVQDWRRVVVTDNLQEAVLAARSNQLRAVPA
jgi:uncharacterized protein (TIGR00730 family)